ncbi:MAG: molybdenum cofactor guanylyltransferase [Myxococcaceae bacterium]|nr:molybdenum cofactor guanylyltransferase [Myxococcaceae bacterium]
MGGVPKGLLRYQGQTVIDRLLSLRALAHHVLLVGDALEAYHPWGLETVSDAAVGKGAPGGVTAALMAASTPWVWVVACDMPFVTEGVVRRLFEAAPMARGACFSCHGRLEPLLGVYAATLGPRWKEQLGENPSFQALFQGSGVTVLPEAELAAIDPGCVSVRSVNTWEDAKAWGLEAPV